MAELAGNSLHARLSAIKLNELVVRGKGILTLEHNSTLTDGLKVRDWTYYTSPFLVTHITPSPLADSGRPHTWLLATAWLTHLVFSAWLPPTPPHTHTPQALSQHNVLSAPLVIAPDLEDLSIGGAMQDACGPSLVGWVDMHDVLQSLISRECHTQHIPRALPPAEYEACCPPPSPAQG